MTTKKDTYYYSIGWEKYVQKPPVKRKGCNFITVKITCLTPDGKVCRFYKEYEEWMGVCTNNIKRIVASIREAFPECRLRFERLGDKLYRKVLPYMEDRLLRGKLESEPKPFYKVYVDAPTEDVGRFFDLYKIAYFEKVDWLVRIYIDMCTRYHSGSFYYNWYDVSDETKNLVGSFRMLPGKKESPDWTIAAFDLETVPLAGEPRVPTGSDPKDCIVMISVVKWKHRSRGVDRHLLYLTPCPETEALSMNDASLKKEDPPVDCTFLQFDTEKEMLLRFHELVDDVHVLTGYNINRFDFPCLFARLHWLKMKDVMHRYSSQTIGDQIVTTYRHKIVVDMYHFFYTFANYNLPGFKLDDVAKTKLGRRKIPVQSTGIHSWYTSKDLVTRSLLDSDDARECFRLLTPRNLTEESFGTFKMYLEYCVVDSELVRQLFEHETALHFLIERGNLNGMDVGKALHLGNSHYLKELMKTMGTCLGHFVNVGFFRNLSECPKLESTFVNGTYQGALNYYRSRDYFRNVAVLDFTSMYPCTLLSANLCYGTSTIMSRKEFSESPLAQSLTAIPYRNHSEADFVENPRVESEYFDYPAFDPGRDEFVIVVNRKSEAFLPQLVSYFLNLRQHHQSEHKKSKDAYHYNSQLNIKILINSLYGIMASKDSCLSKLDVAITIVTLARYQLLGCYHKVTRDGYPVVYADTDSLFVKDYPFDDCDALNEYLRNLGGAVKIKFEVRHPCVLFLSKKKYVCVTLEGEIVTKGFQKQRNDLMVYMTDTFLKHVMTENNEVDPTAGWIVWIETLLEAQYRCRNPKTVTISRKTKSLSEYKSTSCPTAKILMKYPEKAGEIVEYTYSRADVSAKEATRWIMDAEQVEYLNFRQLFRNQEKNFIDLLNIKFWKLPDPHEPCYKVLNTMTWKKFVHAELLYHFKTKEKIVMLVCKGLKYTFEINDHLQTQKRKGKRGQHVV